MGLILGGTPLHASSRKASNPPKSKIHYSVNTIEREGEGNCVKAEFCDCQGKWHLYSQRNIQLFQRSAQLQDRMNHASFKQQHASAWCTRHCLSYIEATGGLLVRIIQGNKNSQFQNMDKSSKPSLCYSCSTRLAKVHTKIKTHTDVNSRSSQDLSEPSHSGSICCSPTSTQP